MDEKYEFSDFIEDVKEFFEDTSTRYPWHPSNIQGSATGYTDLTAAMARTNPEPWECSYCGNENKVRRLHCSSCSAPIESRVPTKMDAARERIRKHIQETGEF